jgi:hypothetical protein
VTTPEAQPVQLSKEQRKADRQLPLPPNTFVVDCERSYQSLRVTGPGAIELWAGGAAPQRSVRVASVKVGWWRRNRVRVSDAAGTSIVFRAIPPGSRGMADVGTKTTGWGAALASGGDDPISFVIFLVVLVAAIFASPWLVARRSKANRSARAIRKAITG